MLLSVMVPLPVLAAQSKITSGCYFVHPKMYNTCLDTYSPQNINPFSPQNPNPLWVCFLGNWEWNQGSKGQYCTPLFLSLCPRATSQQELHQLHCKSRYCPKKKKSEYPSPTPLVRQAAQDLVMNKFEGRAKGLPGGGNAMALLSVRYDSRQGWLHSHSPITSPFSSGMKPQPTVSQ